MPEWIVEEGIGETRAARIVDGEIVETRVRRDGVTPAGTVLEAKLVAVAPRMTVEAGSEQFLLPRGASGVSEGRTLTIEVTREALGGREGWKRGLARVTDAAPCPAPPVVEGGTPGTIEGWDEVLEEARSGIVGFDGGELRIEPTAAMTMIDVDGWLVPDKLAQMAAWAAARAIARLDIGGPVGIDFPTLKGRDQRQTVDAILDDYLPRPFEKTKMNGFGLVQVVRPRARASLVELAADRAGFEARALLRRAGRHVGAGTLVAHPRVAARIGPDAIAALERQVGGRIAVREDETLALQAGRID